MKTKIEPMVSWSIWAGGLSLIMGIVTREQLVQGFQADNTGMSTVIAAVFGAGLVISFLAALQLHSEWRVLKKICVTGTIPNAVKETDLAAVFGRLEAFKKKGEIVDIYAAIETYHSKHNSRARSVSILAALVISMGLLGTVVGLIMSISGLGGMVESVGLSRATMMTALKTTVAGMGTAFYTTFFGALGGLILRAVAVSQLNSLSELCAEATEYATAHLSVRYESKEEELNQQLEKVIESFGAMQTEIEAITSRLGESFESTMKRFGDGLAEAGSHAMDATQDNIAKMTEQSLVTVSEKIDASFDVFSESLEKSSEGVRKTFGKINSSITRYGAKLNKSFDAINQHLLNADENIGASFGSLTQSVQESSDSVAGSLADFKRNLGQVLAEQGEGVVESFDCLTDAVKESTDIVSEALADFKLRVDDSSSVLKDAVGELHSAITEATGEMKTLAGARLDVEATEIAGHLSLAASTIQQLVNKGQQSEESKKVA